MLNAVDKLSRSTIRHATCILICDIMKDILQFSVGQLFSTNTESSGCSRKKGRKGKTCKRVDLAIAFLVMKLVLKCLVMLRMHLTLYLKKPNVIFLELHVGSSQEVAGYCGFLWLCLCV